jgi:hypothetical protein
LVLNGRIVKTFQNQGDAIRYIHKYHTYALSEAFRQGYEIEMLPEGTESEWEV